MNADIVDEAGGTILEIWLPDFVVSKPSPEWESEFKRLLKTDDAFVGVPGIREFLVKDELVKKIAELLKTYVDPKAIDSFRRTAKHIRLIFTQKKKQTAEEANAAVSNLREVAELFRKWHNNESAECLSNHAAEIEFTAKTITQELEQRLKTVKVKQYGRDRQNFHLALSATLLEKGLKEQLNTKKVPLLLANLVYAAEFANKNKGIRRRTPAAIKKAIERVKHSDWPPPASGPARPL